MDNEELRQFKLSNGEELVVEVVDWPDPQQEEWQIVAKNAMKVVSYEDPKEGMRYYAFRPWIIYSKNDTLITISDAHVVGEAIPAEEVKDQYYKALKLEEEFKSYEKKAKKVVKKDPQEILNEFADKIAEKMLEPRDSSIGDNVITFPKDKLH